MPYSRALFLAQLASRPRTLFTRAVRFWYLNRVAFSARRAGSTYGVMATGRARVLPRGVLFSLDALVERLRGVFFESSDVTRLLKTYDRASTLFFVDPPYYGSPGHYLHELDEAGHVRLSETLASISGMFLLTYDDAPRIRELYAGMYLEAFSSRFTAGNQRNRSRRKPSLGRQLLISNRPIRLHAQHT